MTIDQKLTAAVQELIAKFGERHIISRKELISYMWINYQVVSGSVIPSDYCYNRINNGISLSKPTLFEFLGNGEYRCLGISYPYEGVIYHKDQVIGTCHNGKRKIYGISDTSSSSPVIKKRVQQQRDPSPRLRFEVLARDNFTCRYCGASPQKDPSVTLHIDHIIPWSKGGKPLSKTCKSYVPCAI